MSIPSDSTAATSFISSSIQEKGLCLFTATFYTSTQDVRFQLCLDMMEQCRIHNIALVVVDDSPLDIHQALKNRHAGGPTVTISVHPQVQKGRKGTALREALAHARRLPGVTPHTLLCWQEPEKVDMVRHWQHVREESYGSDVVVPFRNLNLFQTTYPLEQFHSERYGNLYLDAVAAAAMHPTQKRQQQFPAALDWHFGPFALQAQHADVWTLYTIGDDSYDAQLVPIVHAARRSLKVASIQVPYEAPAAMKEQEEGNVECIEKRLAQLSELDPRVKRAWTEAFYC